MADLEPARLFNYGTPTEGAFLDALEIRNALNALAQNHLTTDDAFPANARQGQFRINGVDPANFKLDVFINGQFRTVIQNIDKGIAVPTKQVVQFDTAVTPWVIDHNLGSHVVAQVFDSAFIAMKPVNVFDIQDVPLLDIETSNPVGPVLLGRPLGFNGILLSAFAQVEETALAGAGMLIDFLLNAVPVTGGTVTLAGAPLGTVIPGAVATTPNTFAAGDVLDVVTSGVPMVGKVSIVAQMQRTLNTGEYRLTQVNENRITIDHPAATAGFVVLVG